MPKGKNPLVISLNLLKPQSGPETLPVKLIRWLLSSGRYIFIVVEGLVLVAFVARFKLDADLTSKKEAIEEQIPYIESLKPYEILIRQTQLRLSTISNVKENSPDWPVIFKSIADQTPVNVNIVSINIEKNIGNAIVHINGQAKFNSDLSNFIAGLKEDRNFSNVNLASVGLEQEIIKFTIDASANLTGSLGKQL